LRILMLSLLLEDDDDLNASIKSFLLELELEDWSSSQRHSNSGLELLMDDEVSKAKMRAELKKES